MADTIKSALFIDYDSIHRNIAASSGGTASAERIAGRSGEWVAAIESGRLLVAKAGSSERRRVLIRRVYADPKLLGDHRSAFIASGFEVVDAPLLDGRSRNAADVGISLDIVDALDHPTAYEEFIVLSADIDLTPLLFRLRAHNRATAVYITAATPSAYRAIPDAVVDEAALVQLLAAEPATVSAAAPDAGEAKPAPVQGGERNDIEAVARKVHNATSVPLFSPRAYADLFRILAQEIAENGYHFQNTAENVVEKLTAAGRNVTRRQVVFVVKGLALKGHVFSTTDTAEKLAEVFREQVIYLIGNSGLELDDREKALMPAWIAGRVASPTMVAHPAPSVAPPAAPVAPPPVPEPRSAFAEEAKPAKRKAAKPPPPPPAKPSQPVAKPAAAPAKPLAKPAESPVAAKVEPPRPAPVRPPPVVSPPTPTRSIEEIKAAVAARAAAMKVAATGPVPPAQPRPAATMPRPSPASSVPPPVNRPMPPAAAPAAAPASAAPPPPPRPAPSAPPQQRQSPPASAVERPAPPPPRPAAPPPPQAAARASQPANKEALESSILAAIAQAVDVLVEDSAGPQGRREPEAPSMESPAVPEPKPAPEPVAADNSDGGDIGDEIQKIIASYSRARQQGEPQ